MTPAKKSDRLHWIKFNPTEWLGMFPDLSDEEYGMLHKVIAKLWATPGNRLTESALLASLRVAPETPRAAVLRGLIGYALHVSEDGLIYMPALDEAFTEVVTRSKAGAAGAAGRWNSQKPSPKANPEDF